MGLEIGFGYNEPQDTRYLPMTLCSVIVANPHLSPESAPGPSLPFFPLRPELMLKAKYFNRQKLDKELK